ncbi:MAG: hypothetical protein AAF542_21080 [Pseudomonadota bacterium]
MNQTKITINRTAKVLFCIAAIICIFGAAAHELLGAPKVLAPLLNTNLPADVIFLHHFSWHVGTVAVLGIAFLFYMACIANAINYALIASTISAGFSLVALILATNVDPILWTTPAPYPWTLVAILGYVGAYISYK